MYAPDHRDKLTGLARQFRAIATDPTLDPEDLPAVFGQLSLALAEAELLAVCTLREAGHSWTDIGRAAGKTRQAAQQKYGPTECHCGQTPCNRFRALRNICQGAS